MVSDFLAHHGHKDVADALDRLAEAGRSHAYILVGPWPAPKLALASAFAARLLGCGPGELDRQPTFVRLARPVDEKTGEKKKTVPLEAVDEVLARLALSSVGDLPRVALIEDAHLLTDQAQNALLKTVEEPAGRTVLLFLADDPAGVLPTLRSRLVPITLHPTPQETEAAIAPLLNDVRAFAQASRSQRLLTAVAMTKGDEAQAADALQQFVESLAYDVHSTFLAKCATISDDERRAYVRALSQLVDMPKRLRENASPTLALESVAMSLPNH